MSKIVGLLVVAVVWLQASCADAQNAIRGEDLPLYYDFQTGNITIDTTNVTGGRFLGYSLEVPFDGYRVENFTPFMGTFFVDAKSSHLAESNLAGLDAGVYSLGSVLPTGLRQDELEDYFGPTDNPQFGPEYGYFVFAAPGLATYHLLDPQYSPSPYNSLNDPTIGPPNIDRWAERVTLEYNALTGEVNLDSSGEDGGTFWAYEIHIADELFNLDVFTGITDGFALDTNPSLINEVSLSGIREGIHKLGPILPSGITESEMSSLITSATYIGEPGHRVRALDIGINGVPMSLTYVIPEPSGALLSLIAIWLLILQTTRARRKP